MRLDEIQKKFKIEVDWVPGDTVKLHSLHSNPEKLDQRKIPELTPVQHVEREVKAFVSAFDLNGSVTYEVESKRGWHWPIVTFVGSEKDLLKAYSAYLGKTPRTMSQIERSEFESYLTLV